MKKEEQLPIAQQMQLLLGPGGIMENNFPDFHFRSQQLLLAENISSAFINDGFLLAEIGTGVGKTFAYLIPAILWALESKTKVVISTRTKALQQQIVDRDLPELTRIMKTRIKYAEAKGRENYLCWNKYMQILAGRKMHSKNEQDFVQALLVWAEKTRSGDRKELDLSSEAMQNWPIISADRNSCLREQCRYQDKCFRMKMIRNINKADIVVVNHALLLSDVLIENREKSILPDYEYLIIDEAHTFIKESFDRLSYRLALNEIMPLLTALHEKTRGRGRKGYLLHLKVTYPHLSVLITESSSLTDRALSLTGDFFNCLSLAAVYNDSYSFHHVIKPQEQHRPAFEKAIDVYRDWKSNSNLLIDKLQAIQEELSGEEDGPELFGMLSLLRGISDTACLIMEESLQREDGICWLEYDRGRVVALCSSPIYTGDSLDEKLYRNLNTLVMLSATMTVDNSFNNFINRSGLDWYAKDGRLDTLMETSPFDYENNAALYIVEDMPDPASTRFGVELQRVLEEIILASGGRTMVLFTARKQMEEAADFLRPVLEAHDLQLLVQNQDGEFASLMDGFKNNERAVLMGLETFWEGIDLKGDLLKCLVIVKIPFRSPADPYCTAWDKYYRSQNMNSFEYFMLPDATIRLKQGVGRLIRSESDRGIVVVLDTRLIHKKYGQLMQNSLPLTNIAAINSKQLAQKIKEWIE
jgi:ATP-dependent DNA helicase DinG